jgi:hypothetical protein
MNRCLLYICQHTGVPSRAEIIPIEPEVVNTTVGSAMTKLLTPLYTIRHYEKINSTIRFIFSDYTFR